MFSYKNRQIMNNVVVVGCGGTGGRLLPMLGQIMSRGQWNDLVPTITLIDGDEVEVKNLTRQNFIVDDVGRNKAECLAERYGSAFEIPIVCVPRYFEGSENFTRWLAGNVPESMRRLVCERPTTFFLCVDNMKARFEIIQAILYATLASDVEHLIIDAGNENTYGQTRVYSSRVLSGSDVSGEYVALNHLDRLVPKETGSTIPLPYIPCPMAEYLRASGYQGNPDASCADLEQTAAVNAVMAMSMFQIFQNIYMMMPLKVETWFYDIHNGNEQVRFDRSWLEDVFNGNRYKVGRDEDTRIYPVSTRTMKSIYDSSHMHLWGEIEASIDSQLEAGTLERVSPQMAEILGIS
jgi:hypothetical protein